MNYEELLASRRQGKLHQTSLPVGVYSRQQIDGKYRSVVEIHPELNSNIKFTEALKKACEQNGTLRDSHFIHFLPETEGTDIVRLQLESGQYVPLSSLLNEKPSLVAEPGFLEHLTEGLLQSAAYLHKLGHYYVCFSPDTVFLRKGDQAVMLLLCGSYFLSLGDLSAFYGPGATYVAPEVLAHGTVDNRCDIYSIGQFLKTLFADADVPLAYRKAFDKATSEMPEDRYNTAEDMLKGIRQRRGAYQSLVSLAVALVVALIVVGLYFDLVPDQHAVEFVKPAPHTEADELIDEGFRPEDLDTEQLADTALTEQAVATQREYDAKAEEIFRKRYTKEADRILTKMYSKKEMNVNEKNFRTMSEACVKELMEAQKTIAEEASVDPSRSAVIASQIIEQISNQKRNALGIGSNSNGVQR